MSEIATESSEPQAAPAAPIEIDLSSRPEPEWLDRIEGEIDDIDHILRRLARGGVSVCDNCDGLTGADRDADHLIRARCACKPAA